MPEKTARPILRIVRGDATPEEIAAILAVVTAARAGTPTSVTSVAPRPVSAWNNRAAQVRRHPAPGPGAWRASGLPD